MQQEILRYSSGKMGVAAVPGSGKTHTLSLLAAQLITSELLQEGQEILVVTLVNSAVDNFTSRISTFLKEKKLIPNLGYRVRTLHGLAHDIVRERPGLLGLSDNFQIIEEREAAAMLRSIVTIWMHTHHELLLNLSTTEANYESNHKVREQWEDVIIDTVGTFIRSAKDKQLSPSQVKNLLANIPGKFPLLEMGVDVYADYQRALCFRSAVDFDDLIQYALRAIQLDGEYLQRLQFRWPYILEDEAQDSSRLQEELLRLLSSEHGNWVRVGDSNQAIFETFTTADPRFLRNFLAEKGVEPKDLANSGRSSKSIITLANHLIEWTIRDHPAVELRAALTPPFILPSPPGDPQPNPQDDPKAIHLGSKNQTPTEEAQNIVDDINKWLPRHQDDTVAVLVPRNERGAEIVELLKNGQVPYIEMLRSTRSTRQIADALAQTLESLSDPASPPKLASAFRAIAEIHETDPDTQTAINKISRRLRDEHNLEDLFAPAPEMEVRKRSEAPTDDLAVQMDRFLERFKKWHAATLLPIDQLVLTISQDLFTDAVEYALAYKIAGILGQSCTDHPEWHLPDFAGELSQIASNQRKFIGFSEEDTGFDPDAHKGQVVVSTIHKAKGLEWDRVYMVSVNNYDFPALQPQDSYIGEKWFIKDRLNLSEELHGQLDALVEKDPTKLASATGQASMEARIKYASERLRLLYVGITRARKELVISWNTGRHKNCTPALALQELTRFWKERIDAAA